LAHRAIPIGDKKHRPMVTSTKAGENGGLSIECNLKHSENIEFFFITFIYMINTSSNLGNVHMI
jgi:hypothetical protein